MLFSEINEERFFSLIAGFVGGLKRESFSFFGERDERERRKRKKKFLFFLIVL